tara:strand:- start:333 stop:548 length:216 start_codon:yes stop_codon:yes gene_type:complete
LEKEANGVGKMKREKPNYIDTRIDQLKEEMLKPNNEYDRSWYNRLIQELSWVRQMETSPTKNCYMEEGSSP